MRVSLAEARKLNVPEEVLRDLPGYIAPGSRFEGMSPVQAKLSAAVAERWPEAQFDYAGALADRKFELDIAFPELKCAAEIDGWEFHGKYLSGFKRDREKDRLLTLAGWRVLRFTAAEINQQIDLCLDHIAQVRQIARGIAL